jgi:hypothetical protein
MIELAADVGAVGYRLRLFGQARARQLRAA